MHMHRLNAPSESGYYILELLIVTLLFGVLITTASFTFGDISVAPSLKNEGAKIADILRSTVIRAKITAVRQKIQLTSHEVTEHRSTLVGESIVVHELPNKMVLSFPPSRKILRFSPEGITSGVSLTLSQGRKACHIVLSLRGRVVFSC